MLIRRGGDGVHAMLHSNVKSTFIADVKNFNIYHDMAWAPKKYSPQQLARLIF